MLNFMTRQEKILVKCDEVDNVYRSKAKSPLPPFMKLLSKGIRRTSQDCKGLDERHPILPRSIYFIFYTEWNIFHEMDMDTAAETVTDNIKYRMDNVIPETEVTVFPYNKPYITKGVKNCINHIKNCI